MSMSDKIRKFFGLPKSKSITEVKSYTEDLKAETAIRDLAFNTVVNYIADSIVKCPVDVYENGKRLEDPKELAKCTEWYRFNYRPNANQTAAEFWKKAIWKLYNENELLIIKTDDNSFYVADSFQLDDSNAFYPHIFTSVAVNNLTFAKRSFRRDEVIYLQLNNQDISDYLDKTAELYGKMIIASYRNYLASTGIKGFMKIDVMAEADPATQNKVNEDLKKSFNKLFESQNGVISLTNGYDYIPLKDSGQRVAATDFKTTLNEMVSTVCLATGVPSVLITGQVAGIEQAIDQMLTFCIDPLCKKLEQAINTLINTPKELASGNGCFFYTRALKHVDLVGQAQSIAAAISCGGFTRDEIRRACGYGPLPDGEGKKVLITKNYEDSTKGGENSETDATDEDSGESGNGN